MNDNVYSVMELKAQMKICRQYGLPDVPPEDMVALAVATIGKMPIYGQRNFLSAEENISWFFYCGESSSADDFYQPLHTEHLREMLPSVIKYLRLPPGSKFIIDDQGHEEVWRE